VTNHPSPDAHRAASYPTQHAAHAHQRAPSGAGHQPAQDYTYQQRPPTHNTAHAQQQRSPAKNTVHAHQRAAPDARHHVAPDAHAQDQTHKHRSNAHEHVAELRVDQLKMAFLAAKRKGILQELRLRHDGLRIAEVNIYILIIIFLEVLFRTY
jgi:hypothetical protein